MRTNEGVFHIQHATHYQRLDQTKCVKLGVIIGVLYQQVNQQIKLPPRENKKNNRSYFGTNGNPTEDGRHPRRRYE